MVDTVNPDDSPDDIKRINTIWAKISNLGHGDMNRVNVITIVNCLAALT